MYPHLTFENFLGKHIHLGVCGSIAAYKSLDLLRSFTGCGLGVSATPTAAACEFVTPLSFSSLGAEPVYKTMFSPSVKPFDHLAPATKADAFILAPATANTIAKLAHGMADNMLTCQALAFAGPVVVAPAMNHGLWQAPATQAAWQQLQKRGYTCLDPGVGQMACGTTGKGRLPDLESIFIHGLRAVAKKDLQGKKVLITLGPTQEPFDCVRHWTNRSSGTMGGAVAVAAWLRGAEVHAVCGPINLWLPHTIQQTKVQTAKQMYEACMETFPDMDIACLVAAVADHAPVNVHRQKWKKTSGPLHVDLEENPDILLTLGKEQREGQYLIGFAAESKDVEKNAKKKLKAKKAHMIVANNVLEKGSGFGESTNSVLVLDAKGRQEHWPVLPKTEVAWRILDWALGL